MNNIHSIIPDGSRREFLKTTAATVAGLGLAGAMAPAVHAAGDESLKVALIGCGNRGAGALLQALSTEGPVKLWALADAFSDRLEQCLGGVRRSMSGEQRERGASKSARRKAGSSRDALELPNERKFVG